MLSTLENPEVVDEYLHKELLEGRIADITDKAGLLPIQISPLGVIPKKHTPGKWRLIVDLSSPKDFSVNDGIPKEFCSLSYVSVDDVAKHVLELGPGTRMAKVDIRSAYRHVPVHPDDRPLLGMQWRGHICVDKALPFGLRSAPRFLIPLQMHLSGSSKAEELPGWITTWMTLLQWVIPVRIHVQEICRQFWMYAGNWVSQ